MIINIRGLAMILSVHAECRRQQRAISSDMLGLLLECGAVAHSKGDEILHLRDKRAWKAALLVMDDIGMKPDNRLRKLYAVIGRDGIIVTVGWRNNPILLDWNPRKNGKHKRRRNKRRRYSG